MGCAHSRLPFAQALVLDQRLQEYRRDKKPHYTVRQAAATRGYTRAVFNPTKGYY